MLDKNVELMEKALYDDDITKFILFSKNVDLSKTYISGTHILPFAVDLFGNDILTFLIDQGLDINIKNSRGRTPLMVAVVRGNMKATRLLLQAGTDLSITNNYGGTALELAANYKNLDAVKLLLEYGANIDSQNDDGHTPAMVAWRSGFCDVTKFLIEAGSSMDIKDKDGKDLLKHIRGYGGDEKYRAYFQKLWQTHTVHRMRFCLGA